MRKHEDEVLEYLNGLRAEFGIGDPLSKLPPDLPIDDPRTVSFGCPVAVALERDCGIGQAYLLSRDEKHVLVTFPDFVTSFQNAHDDRRARRSWYLHRASLPC